MKYHYNDNELLYLIAEKDDSALEIMFKKYTPLIRKRISEYKMVGKNSEDYFQEGLMMLVKSIETYCVYYNKTFNKYFDLILQRKMFQLLKKERKYLYNVSFVEDCDQLAAYENNHKNMTYLDELNATSLSKYEMDVIKNAYVDLKTCKEISEEMKCSIRKVYNALARAKKKLRDNNI